MRKRFPKPIDAACNVLCQWLETNRSAFRPSGAPGVPSLEDVKPLTEFALILYELTGPRHRPAAGPLVAWANQMAETLWAEAGSFGALLPWKAIADTVRERPEAGGVVLPFFLLDELTGRRCAFREDVQIALASAARRRAGLDLAFWLDLAGLRDCEQEARAAFQRTIAGWHGDVSSVGSSWLYNLTHQIFYTTKLGRRRPAWRVDEHAWLAAALGPLAFSRLRLGDFDLAAELLLCMAWSRIGIDPTFQEGLDILTAAVVTEQGVPTYPPATNPDASEFVKRYHPTLVVLAALAESKIVDAD